MTLKSSLSHRAQEPENGVLYVVGTPIGNLSDISERALNILKNVFLIACEDTRTTKIIMSKYDFSNKLMSFNQHNSKIKIPKIINYLKDGKSIAIVSDAGLPGISDPGEEIVREAKKYKLDIICIPGPCAALTALVVSGIPSSKFIFEGFLPKRKVDREKIIIDISKNKKTTILYESPRRIKALLKELKEYCGGDREINISRELTKKFEEHIGPNIDSAIEFFDKNKTLGEFTIVIKGTNNSKSTNKAKLKKDLHQLVDAGLSLSAAAKYLAKKEKITKSIIYKLY
tara:strand:- start:1007 stop:1864 length:858 start_codon:yes stop_codon:yes gene_type:complete